MFNFIKKIYIGVTIYFLLISLSACSLIPRQSDGKQSVLTPKNPTGFTKNQEEDASTFVGVWRGTMHVPQLQEPDCQREYVFQSNGKFSATMVCGSLRTWQTGDWRIVQQGVLRFEIADYEPKKYAGGKVHMPDGETNNYHFINQNQLRMDSAVAVQGFTSSDFQRVQ